MNAQAALTTGSLESTLLMREWGKWARNVEGGRLGFIRPGWVNQIRQGYREEDNDPDEYLPDISDEYGLHIDDCLLELDTYSRTLMVLYYEKRVSLNNLAKILKKSKQRISTDRDCALSALYGLVRGKST